MIKTGTIWAVAKQNVAWPYFPAMWPIRVKLLVFPCYDSQSQLQHVVGYHYISKSECNSKIHIKTWDI